MANLRNWKLKVIIGIAFLVIGKVRKGFAGGLSTEILETFETESQRAFVSFTRAHSAPVFSGLSLHNKRGKVAVTEIRENKI